MFDKDLHLARALLIEGNALLRSTTASQLRDIGVGEVAGASHPSEARLRLERERFDIVVCSRDFEGSEESGQDLLDELRRERLLPHDTVFLMLTTQASYHQVVEAAEASLDAFLVRPCSSAALGQRLAEARQRKRELAVVLRALDAGEAELALVHSVKRFADKAPYWVYCGRLAAELMLALKRPDDAARLFDKLVAARNTAWARLGLARARLAAGDTGESMRLTQELLHDEHDCADARDLLGRVHVEQCDFDLALEQYRAATLLTPGCLLRQQHTGALAFYQGHPDEALAHLEQALALGPKSNLFDVLSLMIVAMLRHDRGDVAGVAAAREQLRRWSARYPSSARLRRFEWSADALHLALTEGPAAAAPTLATLSEQVPLAHFDLEAATVMLALAKRLVHAFASGAEYEKLILFIGMRFAGSKAITETLLAASGHEPRAEAILQRCQVDITAAAESAMEMALHGDPEAAVRALVQRGESTRNVRLLELARSLLHRHMDWLTEGPSLLEQTHALLQRYGIAMNHIAGIQRSGRAPGAMNLRGVNNRQGSG